MKKKITIIPLLFAAILGVILLFLSHHPRIVGKIFEHKIIDLRKTLPKGKFRKVSIVVNDFGGKDYEYISFEVSDDKMEGFEAGFRKCVQNAISRKGIFTCLPNDLRIQADKGKYFAKIHYNDDVVTIFGGFFHRGFWSRRELRKVFYDAGLGYSAGEPKEKEINEPNHQEILREIGIKAAEYGRRIKEAKGEGNTLNQPLQNHSE